MGERNSISPVWRQVSKVHRCIAPGSRHGRKPGFDSHLPPGRQPGAASEIEGDAVLPGRLRSRVEAGNSCFDAASNFSRDRHRAIGSAVHGTQSTEHPVSAADEQGWATLRTGICLPPPPRHSTA
jgi:hypothetical protein